MAKHISLVSDEVLQFCAAIESEYILFICFQLQVNRQMNLDAFGNTAKSMMNSQRI